MAGTTIRLAPLQTIDWSTLQGSGTMDVVVADHIDLSAYKYGQLLVRLHGNSSIGSGASAVFNLRGIDPSNDDPSLTFDIGPIMATPITLNNSSVVPSMQVENLSASFGATGRLIMTLTQAGSPVTAMMWFSVDLVLKTEG